MQFGRRSFKFSRFLSVCLPDIDSTDYSQSREVQQVPVLSTCGHTGCPRYYNNTSLLREEEEQEEEEEEEETEEENRTRTRTRIPTHGL